LSEPRKETLKLEELLLQHIENQVTRAKAGNEESANNTVPATALALVELWKLRAAGGRFQT
jgi:hypothetical protein